MPETSELERLALDFTNDSRWNYISKEEALSEDCAGLRIYDEPIFGYADTHDALFEKYKERGVVGPQFMAPDEWLEGAETVVSFFLPFTDRVKRSNTASPDTPSTEWLHARIEGQRFIGELAKYLKDYLEANGFKAVVPSSDKRFKMVSAPNPELTGPWEGASFTSNWSERHAAYACGLGTFGLSKGLITAKGMAGRFGSIVTTARFPASLRPYTGVYDYCIRCGACARRCPAQAITLENGKDQIKCGVFVGNTLKKYKPWYGCGKCQVNVPCEKAIPKRS